MYLQKIEIENYKVFSKTTPSEFHNGLNVLVGENGCGKSSIIDAIRLLLIEDEYGRKGITDYDFHRGFASDEKPAEKINMVAYFSSLSEDEKIAFLPWHFDDTRISLNLTIENKTNNYGRYKRALWGGRSKSSMFETELFDFIKCIYLPPLRDAESRLKSGKNSRLARLLINLAEQEDSSSSNIQKTIESKVKSFNETLANEEPISNVNDQISGRLSDALGSVFAQNTSIQFSEVEFRRIVENLQLLFYPFFDLSTPKELFRSLEENSLGFNNIIYLATVLAELRDVEQDKQFLNLLLIEEPEAHLHPQLQVKLMQYLEELTQKQENVQIIITTHSPVISSTISLNSIIHINKIDPTLPEITAIPIRYCGLSIETKDFLERWLDITKSTLLFAKGIIFVEGIAEGMLIPVLAKRYLSIKNESNPNAPKSLKEAGVSVINMNGIFFNHFMMLFCDIDGNTNSKKIPTLCSGITDKDPPKSSTQTDADQTQWENPALALIEPINRSTNCRLMVSPQITLEYDLAMESENLKIMLPIKDFQPRDKEIKNAIDELKSKDWSKIQDLENKRKKAAEYMLNHIGKGDFAQQLAYTLEKNKDITFDIPDYIQQAIEWVTSGVKHEDT
jgi:predicted ATP-dependent endonuclease of OLD family